MIIRNEDITRNTHYIYLFIYFDHAMNIVFVPFSFFFHAKHRNSELNIVDGTIRLRVGSSHFFDKKFHKTKLEMVTALIIL